MLSIRHCTSVVPLLEAEFVAIRKLARFFGFRGIGIRLGISTEPKSLQNIWPPESWQGLSFLVVKLLSSAYKNSPNILVKSTIALIGYNTHCRRSVF